MAGAIRAISAATNPTTSAARSVASRLAASSAAVSHRHCPAAWSNATTLDSTSDSRNRRRKNALPWVRWWHTDASRIRPGESGKVSETMSSTASSDNGPTATVSMAWARCARSSVASSGCPGATSLSR